MTARERAADVDVAAWLRDRLHSDGGCRQCNTTAALLDRLERAEAAVRTAELAIDAVSKYADAETERANEAERKVAAGLALADELEAAEIADLRDHHASDLRTALAPESGASAGLISRGDYAGPTRVSIQLDPRECLFGSDRRCKRNHNHGGDQ